MFDAWVGVVENILKPYSFLILSCLIFLFLQSFIVLLLVFSTRDVVAGIIVVSAKLVIALVVEVETIRIIEISSLIAVLILQDVKTIFIIVSVFCIDCGLGLLLAFSGLVLDTVLPQLLVGIILSFHLILFYYYVEFTHAKKVKISVLKP